MDEAEYRREATERTIVIDGHPYEIDLCEFHGAALDTVKAKWVEHARKVTSGGVRRRTQAQRDETRRVRNWAIAAGLPVDGKGRISAGVWAKYRAAHSS
jgi:hypothetical protein